MDNDNETPMVQRTDALTEYIALDTQMAKNRSLINENVSKLIHLLLDEVFKEEQPLHVKRLSESAALPVRASSGAAGYDLSAAHDAVIPAKGKGIVKTDLCMIVPPGTYGRIAPRSGLAVKSFIDVGAGVIDSDYRGNVGIVLFNFGTTDFNVAHGDRVAQLILERCCTPHVVETMTTNLDQPQHSTGRDAAGFGSTGVRPMSPSLDDVVEPNQAMAVAKEEELRRLHNDSRVPEWARETIAEEMVQQQSS